MSAKGFYSPSAMVMVSVNGKCVCSYCDREGRLCDLFASLMSGEHLDLGLIKHSGQAVIAVV